MTQFALRYGAEMALLSPGPFRIGRARESDLWIRDRMVSRCHVILNVAPDGVEVVDQGSKNGVWLNGRRIRQARLQDGDLLTIGAHELRFATVTEVRRRSTTGPMIAGRKLGTPRPEPEDDVSEGPTIQVRGTLLDDNTEQAEAAMNRCLTYLRDRSALGRTDGQDETLRGLAKSALELAKTADRWDPLLGTFELYAEWGQPPAPEILAQLEQSVSKAPAAILRAITTCVEYLLRTGDLSPAMVESTERFVAAATAKDPSVSARVSVYSGEEPSGSGVPQPH